MVVVKHKNDEKEKLWNKLIEYTNQLYPICCTSSDETAKSSLAPGHSYTLVYYLLTKLACALLEDTEGVHHKLMKLRDPWGRSGWDGLASEKDRVFWNKLVTNKDKK